MAFQVTPDTSIAEAAMFHGVVASLSAAQSVANLTQTVIEWDDVEIDTDGFLDTSSGEFTVPEGVFLVEMGFGISWSSGATGFSQVGIQINGVTEHRLSVGNAKFVHLTTRTFVVQPGDVLRCRAYQSSGGSLDVNADNETFVQFRVIQTPHGRPDSPTLP